VPAVTELMDEHADLTESASWIRQALDAGDVRSAHQRFTRLKADLERHVRREETGILRALRDSGEFVGEVDGLEAEHRDLAADAAGLDPDSPDYPAMLMRVLADLSEHIEREELGVFPVSIVTLGARGWQTVDEAHSALPSPLAVRSRS
jgi:hypothetical protein